MQARIIPGHQDPAGPSCTDSSPVKRSQDFLLILKEYLDPILFSREGRRCHYEDLYSAAYQVLQDEELEVPNPLIAGAIQWLKCASAHLWVGQESDISDVEGHEKPFATLVQGAVRLVQWAVFHALARVAKPTGLDMVTKVAKSCHELDIFSLNHDLLIEAQLAKSKQAFYDGFSSTKQGDTRLFVGEWPRASHGVRLLKLHGSINWYRYRIGKSYQFASVQGSPEHCGDRDGRPMGLLDVEPMFLTGTGVKEQTYGVGLFGELFAEFRRLLRTHHTLIACGYGWGDKGINTRIREWMLEADKNRIIILHADSNVQLRGNGFFLFRWQEWKKAGKLIVIRKWLSRCTFSDLQPYLED